jgi:hypothetical protein
MQCERLKYARYNRSLFDSILAQITTLENDNINLWLIWITSSAVRGCSWGSDGMIRELQREAAGEQNLHPNPRRRGGELNRRRPHRSRDQLACGRRSSPR